MIKNKVIGLRCVSLAVIVFIGCTQKHSMQQTSEKHQAEFKSPDGGLVYADRISNEAVIKNVVEGNGKSAFITYKVGFIDSALLLNNELRQKKGKYIQYDMQNDWKAVIKGDSILPVFTQPLIKRNAERDEMIIVFEIPENAEPDTLFYTDSFNGYGAREIILKNK